MDIQGRREVNDVYYTVHDPRLGKPDIKDMNMTLWIIGREVHSIVAAQNVFSEISVLKLCNINL